MKWTPTDTIGFLLATVICIVPFEWLLFSFGPMALGDDIKHPYPIGPRECMVAAVVVTFFVAVSSAFACWLGRGSVAPEFLQTSQIFTHLGLALVMLLVLIPAFFCGLGRFLVRLLP